MRKLAAVGEFSFIQGAQSNSITLFGSNKISKKYSLYVFKVIGPKILLGRKGKSTETLGLLQTMDYLGGWSSNVWGWLSSRVIKSLSC